MLLVIAIGAALPRYHTPAGDPRDVTATGTPGPPQRDTADTKTPEPMTGNAPWALSALPDCFTQVFEAHGRLARVLTHEPRGSREVPPGATLRSGDCTVRRSVSGDSLDVRRGADTRMRVEHVAALAIDTMRAGGAPRVSLALRSSPAMLRVYRAQPRASVR